MPVRIPAYDRRWPAAPLPRRQAESDLVGELRERVTLQSKTQSAAGGSGGTTLADAYNTVATVWAMVEALRGGGDYVAGQQTEAIVTHRVVIRHRADANDWSYLLIGTRRLRVHATRDIDGRKRFLEILAEELSL